MLSEVWKHGDLTKLAARRRVSLQAISQWLSGNGEQRFAIDEALADLQDIFAINQEAGELLKAYIDSCCQSYRAGRVKCESRETLLAAVEKESSDVVVANLRKFPRAVQLKEVAEGQEALTEYRESLERDDVAQAVR